MSNTEIIQRATVDLPALKSGYDDAVNDIIGRLGAPSSNTLRVTQSKMLVLPDGTESAGPLPYVIVDFVYENRYYDTPYSRNKVVPPVCAAVNPKGEALAPFEDSPKVQASTCSGCPQNRFKTAPNGGNGKACTNAVLIALLDPFADPEAPLIKLRTSPTGITPFETYVRTLVKVFGRPLHSVLTYIGFDPKSEYPSLRFGDPKPLDTGEPMKLADRDIDTGLLLKLAAERRSEARELLLAKPEFAAEETPANPEPARGSRRATA